MMGPIGIGITKGLPYTIFMKQIIYEITERGITSTSKQMESSKTSMLFKTEKRKTIEF